MHQTESPERVLTGRTAEAGCMLSLPETHQITHFPQQRLNARIQGRYPEYKLTISMHVPAIVSSYTLQIIQTTAARALLKHYH
jgi:hypothetical protein